MFKRTTIRTKLIVVFGVALAGILVLSISGNLALKKNVAVGHVVKDKKFDMAIRMEKTAAMAHDIINRIDSSANQATDSELLKAEGVKGLLIKHLKENRRLADDGILKKRFDQLESMTEDVYRLGERRVELVVDQDFAEIPEATEAFHRMSEHYLDLVSQLQKLARKDLESALDKMVNFSMRSAVFGFIVTLVVVPVVVIFSILVYFSVFKPIKHLEVVMGDLVGGDLTVRSKIAAKDEMGNLSASLNGFIEGLRRNIQQIIFNSGSLDAASSGLYNISQQMSAGAEQTAFQAETVSAGAEELSGNTHSVAAAMAQAATNVDMVASAADQMAATINEIARNTEKARDITDGAVSRSRDASIRVGELGEAAKAIGKVVEAIAEISDQVNLLALNATIEAARAGEAGKGFAVVANEIKELARQTAEATGEINTRIEGIQTSTESAVKGIGGISNVVTEIDEIVTVIATAVDEQSATTREIAKNVSQAASGIGEVNKNVAQSSSAADEIAREIAKVSQGSAEMSSGSDRISNSAGELSKLAQELNGMVGRFKV